VEKAQGKAIVFQKNFMKSLIIFLFALAGANLAFGQEKTNFYNLDSTELVDVYNCSLLKLSKIAGENPDTILLRNSFPCKAWKLNYKGAVTFFVEDYYLRDKNALGNYSVEEKVSYVWIPAIVNLLKTRKVLTMENILVLSSCVSVQEWYHQVSCKTNKITTDSLLRQIDEAQSDLASLYVDTYGIYLWEVRIRDIFSKKQQSEYLFMQECYKFACISVGIEDDLNLVENFKKIQSNKSKFLAAYKKRLELEKESLRN
jgi:hypothetical protein